VSRMPTRPVSRPPAGTPSKPVTNAPGGTPARGDWTAWFRRDADESWKQVGRFPTQEEGWRAVIAGLHGNGDWAVCRPGVDPNMAPGR
jgi:hypothetical protein